MALLPHPLLENLGPFSSRPRCFSMTLSTPQPCSKAPHLRSVAFAWRGSRMWFSHALTPTAFPALNSGMSITRLARSAEKLCSQLMTDGWDWLWRNLNSSSLQVISDGPDSLDIATEIQKSLMEIASTPWSWYDGESCAEDKVISSSTRWEKHCWWSALSRLGLVATLS